MNLELEPEPEVEEAVAGAGGEPAINILITRHSFSCNQKTSIKAFDPALTRNGINMAMERAKYKVRGERLYDSNVVLVSCLLRTWQTALLLYNPDISDVEETDSDSESGLLLLEIKNLSPRTNFTLYVYPYLKEHIKAVKVPFVDTPVEIKRGNYPTELKLTLANFLKFLEFIRLNYPVYYNNSLPSQININIWNAEGPPLTFLLTRTTNDSPFVVEINEEDCHGCIRQSDSEIINQFVDGSKFVEEGDLDAFVSHICELSPPVQNRLGPNGIIHVVAHSSLMRTYLSRIPIDGGTLPINDEQGIRRSFARGDDIDGVGDMVINNISETNMFSFEMGCSGDIATLNKIYLGLRIPAPPTERNRELCDMGEFRDPGLVPVPKSESEQDTYGLGNNVMITGTRTPADGKTGKIIGTYINGILLETNSTDGIMLGLTPDKFKRIERNENDVIRVEYTDDSEESVKDNFLKENIHSLSPENSVTLTPGNSVTLTLAGGGRLKKSKRKNKKTTKRNKNKNKSKRRKKTRARRRN